MKSLGFDPGAHVTIGYGDTFAVALAEATLERDHDGRLLLRAQDDEGRVVTVSLRADFLEAFVALRAREAAA